MLTRLQIENFRCFRQLTVDPLKRINLICGQNNSGKTALLEALFALPRPQEGSKMPELLHTFRVQSSGPSAEDVSCLFYDKDKNAMVNITGWMDQSPIGVEVRYASQPEPSVASSDNTAWQPNRIIINSEGLFQRTHYSGAGYKVRVFPAHSSKPEEDTWDFSRAILKKQKDRIAKLMGKIEPRLVSIEALQIDRNRPPRLYADMGLREMIPITHLGQGFGRLLNIYSGILVEDANVLLIDEIENGLHHSVLPTAWKGLMAAARDIGVQIFATTHSWECIRAANAVVNEAGDSDDFQVIRLDRIGDDIKSTTIDKEMIETAKEFNLEMR